eukprot:gene1254-11343_t
MSTPIRIESKKNTALSFLSNIQFDKEAMKPPSSGFSPTNKESYMKSPRKKNSSRKSSPTKDTKVYSSPVKESALSFLTNIKTTSNELEVSKPQEVLPNVKLRSDENQKKFEKIELKDKIQESSLRVAFTVKGAPFVSSFFKRIQTSKDTSKENKSKEESSYESSLLKSNDTYDPTFLDDPSMGIGSRRTVMNLPGFLCSTIPFVKKSEVMDDLDETFAEDHPDIAAQISLSEIRNLKKKIYESCRDKKEFLVEIGTIAVAIVYLEKLIIKGFVNKQNKTLVSAVCLILAAKFNEHHKDWNEFMDDMEDNFGLSKKKIIEMEWIVFSEELEFNLFVSNLQVSPHLRHLLLMQGLSLEEFLENNVVN